MTCAYARRLEDELGPDEPRYRSRGEAQVGRALGRHGIPFLYEAPTLIFDRGRYRIWHPDFTLPTLDSLIVEYAGMMDRPEYADGQRHKQRVYAANQRAALFFYPTDLMGADWPGRLIARVFSAAASAGAPFRAPNPAPNADGKAGP